MSSALLNIEESFMKVKYYIMLLIRKNPFNVEKEYTLGKAGLTTD